MLDIVPLLASYKVKNGACLPVLSEGGKKLQKACRIAGARPHAMTGNISRQT